MNKLRLTFATILAIIGIAYGSMTPHNSAHAACAVRWIINNETINFCDGTSENGTFTSKLEKDSEDGIIVTITLNNYQGPAFYAESYGSGIEVTKYVVNLTGSNEITLDNIEKVYTSGIAYELTGDGQLLVKTANQSTDCVSTLPDNIPISNNENLPDDALIGPTKPVDTWDVITWFAIRIALITILIATGVFATLGVIWLRSKKSPRKPQNLQRSRKPSKKR